MCSRKPCHVPYLGCGGGEGRLNCFSESSPPPPTNTSMGTCTLEPHTVHKHSLPPLSFLDKNTIKGTPSHCGNCISLCGLHVPRTELGQQCGSVCVNMDHKGQDPVLTHPSEQVGAFVSQLKGLPPCLHPTCLPPSVHPSTSGGFLGSPGQPIYLLG